MRKNLILQMHIWKQQTHYQVFTAGSPNYYCGEQLHNFTPPLQQASKFYHFRLCGPTPNHTTCTPHYSTHTPYHTYTTSHQTYTPPNHTTAHHTTPHVYHTTPHHTIPYFYILVIKSPAPYHLWLVVYYVALWVERKVSPKINNLISLFVFIL